MTLVELEQKRLMALRRYGLLDTPPEAIFDGITVAIANICEVPVALVSLVDENRQWFKSAYGLQVRETPRDTAFCSHAIERPDRLMIVEDAATDERFCNNPLVLGDPNIRFYAGMPIVTRDGLALGTLCVIDRKPRRLSAHQLDALQALSKTVSAILDERRKLQDIVIDRDGIDEVVRESARQFQHLYQDTELLLRGVLQLLPTAAIAVNPSGEIVSSNEAWNQFSTSSGWTQASQGENFIVACAHDSAPFSDGTSDFSVGLQAVLAGYSDKFEFKYISTNGTCTVDVTSNLSPGSGATIQHYYSSSH